jgi:hypothetical protein
MAPSPRTLRRALWILNLGLAALAAVAWVHYFGAQADAPREPWTPVAPARALPAAREGIDPAVMRATLDWMYGVEADTTSTAPPVPVPNRLPLGAYRVALWCHDPTGPDAVAICSKDPAHPGTHYLREGATTDGFEVVSIVPTFQDRLCYGKITLRRGEETCTFEVLTGGGRGPEVIRLTEPADLRTPPPTEPRLPAQVPAPALTDLKVVPFYGEGAKIAGLRVTGVRPGSDYARIGIKPGDVLRAADGVLLADTQSLRRALSSRGAGLSLSVGSIDGGASRELQILR